MIHSPRGNVLNPSPFVLHDPDLFLVELRLEPFFFRLPKPHVSTRVAHLIHPVVFREEMARWAQPRAFRLPFPSPDAKLRDHSRVKRSIALLVEWLAQVVALGEQDLRDKRHPFTGVCCPAQYNTKKVLATPRGQRPSSRRIWPAMTSGGGAISTTRASSGGSGVSNWLCSSDGFMKCPLRAASRRRGNGNAFDKPLSGFSP